MKIKTFIPLTVFLIIAIFLWRGLGQDPHKIPSPLKNKPLPHFHAVSLQTPEQTITNNDLIGYVILLNIFASWCLSCRAEHPTLMDIKQAGTVKIYGVNYKDQRQTALQWLARFGNPYQKIIYDPKGQLGIDLGVYGTPETFVIDKKGVIRYKYIGPLSKAEWQAKVLPVVRRLEQAS